jgi:hypothetical protein
MTNTAVVMGGISLIGLVWIVFLFIVVTVLVRAEFGGSAPRRRPRPTPPRRARRARRRAALEPRGTRPAW